MNRQPHTCICLRGSDPTPPLLQCLRVARPSSLPRWGQNTVGSQWGRRGSTSGPRRDCACQNTLPGMAAHLDGLGCGRPLLGAASCHVQEESLEPAWQCQLVVSWNTELGCRPQHCSHTVHRGLHRGGAATLMWARAQGHSPHWDPTALHFWFGATSGRAVDSLQVVLKEHCGAGIEWGGPHVWQMPLLSPSAHTA